MLRPDSIVRWAAICGGYVCLTSAHALAGEHLVVESETLQTPSIYLVAARQKDRIRESLRAAGVEVGDDIVDATDMLRVTIGTQKGSRACGTRNNVKYSLRRDGQERVLLQHAGWTGTCEPNVFEELSAQLAQRLRREHGEDRR